MWDQSDDYADDYDDENSLNAKPKPCNIPPRTMSVRKMAEMLGLHKTDSYWLVHKNFFKTIMVAGKMRIDIESFEDWYSWQIKYKKMNGDPPGEQLREESYDAHDISGMLGISESSVYDLMNKEKMRYILVDYWKRWPKKDFDEWYKGQKHYRIGEDRKTDAEERERSMSMPEMAWLLGVPRYTVYSLLSEARVNKCFEFVIVGDQKRVTKESFRSWYGTQKKYHMVFDTIEEAQADKAMALLEKIRSDIKAPAEETLQDYPLAVRQAVKKSGNPDYYSVDEVAKILKVTPKHVRQRIREGKIPGKRIGNGNIYRINRVEFDRWYIDNFK